MEDWLGVHEAFKQGFKVTAHTIWSEFKACKAFGLDPDVYFAKHRHMRAFITGGNIADGALETMKSYDSAKEREEKAKRKGKNK